MKIIQEILLRPQDTIRAAMTKLRDVGLEITLVTDEKGVLLGTLTDGDIRRALLSGATLESPVGPYMHCDFTVVGPDIGRAEVLDLMLARSLRHIPIVERGGVLKGIHLIREIIGAVTRQNWAVIMAGGRGERLKPLTDSIPKPMIKVAGRPIIERIVLHLVGFGIRRIFIAVNYKAELIENRFKNGSAFGCRIDYLREDQPLGTGGAISLLSEKPTQPLLVLNGDILTQFDVGQMLAFHEEGKYLATIGVHEYLHTVPFGVVETSNGLVKEIREKPTQSWLANAGIYIIDQKLIDRVPKGKPYFMPTLIEECLARKEPVGAFRVEDDWIDVGRHQELLRARGESGNA